MDNPPIPPHRYAEPRLTAAWYDLRGFLAARRLLLRDPRVALQGEAALGFSPSGFARFLWIVIPFGVLAALATVNGVLLEQPNQVFDLNADAAAELRQRVAPDAALWREAGIEPGREEQITPAQKEAALAARREMASLHIMPFIALDNAQIGEAERRATLEAIEQGLRTAGEGEDAIVRLQLALKLEARLAATEKRLRFLRRLVDTGAANLLGMVFTGMILPLTAIAFAWWARRVQPAGEHVAEAKSVMLYLLNARLTPWMFLLLALMVGSQIGISWQIAWLANWSAWALIGMTLLLAVVYFRCGRPIATALYTAPDPRVVRKLSWRMLWVFGLLQLVAALWAGLLTAAMTVYFSRFA